MYPFLFRVMLKEEWVVLFSMLVWSSKIERQIFLFQVLFFAQEQHNTGSMLWRINCQGQSNGHCSDGLSIYKDMKALAVQKEM